MFFGTQRAAFFSRYTNANAETVLFPTFYAILDATPAQSLDSHLSLAQKLATAGVQLIQLRAKHVPARQFQEIATALLAAAPKNARIIINDRPDIASIAHAAGVHVG